MSSDFAVQGSREEVESGSIFQPKFDPNGLIPAIVVDSASKETLMFAWMSRDALAATIKTRRAHFWSRSRGRLWRKGEESGNELVVQKILTDCDQDVVLLHVEIMGRGVACHTGSHSCFYRKLDLEDDAPTDLASLALTRT